MAARILITATGFSSPFEHERHQLQVRSNVTRRHETPAVLLHLEHTEGHVRYVPDLFKPLSRRRLSVRRPQGDDIRNHGLSSRSSLANRKQLQATALAAFPIGCRAARIANMRARES